MPVKVEIIEVLPITELDVTVKLRSGAYRATLTANGQPWRGDGQTVTAALRQMLRSISDERRAKEKGRPSNRYRIAQSL